MSRINFINTGKIKEENGAVLIVALIMLCLLTIIATAVSNTTSMETMISGADKDKKETFYAAEAGVDHIKGLMNSLFLPKNNLKIAQGQTPDWDFALNGTSGVTPASGMTWDSGSQWIADAELGNNVTYDVFVWNNDDGGTATDDTDGVVYIRAEAVSLQGGSSSIEVSIQGSISGADTVTDYDAQEGGGWAKSFTSGDSNPIDAGDFNKQL